MPHVALAEESKTGLGFEIGPTCNDVQQRPNVQLSGNPAVAGKYHNILKKAGASIGQSVL